MLHVHRAERADALVDALRRLLAAPLPDPFAAEVVAVPTRGMERWLAQRMSARLGASPGRADGVCANVDFPSPRRLILGAVAAASGIAPDEDPWLPGRAVWPLLEVVDECREEPWLRPLAQHVARRERRFATVRHVAELFDSYALHRPAMLRAWAAGEGDGWQAELWRRLRARIGVAGPAERVHAACERLVREPEVAELPERFGIFGLTRLPAAHLDVLRALAARRDVHLFLLHPSPALWDRITPFGPVVRRAEDPTAALPVNRLLASWGQDAREMQLVLAGDLADHHHAIETGGDTLLARLQGDVRADRSPPGPPLPGHADARMVVAPGDRSLQVHACHGRARQVEVLRDAILHALAEDPGLEPRDVIVMCPDIETFAPLIQAAFGAGEEEDAEGPVLRVRLADRSLRQTNPVLGVVAQLIDLAEQRLTASQVLGLADREPVRRRFRLDDDDLARMQDWVADSGIRWGLDAEHRTEFRLEELPAGTWRAGLDRLLLGVTMTEDEQRLFRGVLPLDDVESGAIELAGRFAELIDRLQQALDSLAAPQTVHAWAAALAAAADALTATPAREGWQRAELERVLEDVVAEAAGSPVELALPEVRALLAERLQGRPTRANFRTGHLTVCTLVPMRSVPHRVVCLLGLDDGAFPRKGPRDGDDLVLDDPHVGDRDPRSEDRQMLLDALLAAGDRLIVTYTGNDERTNAPRPPAVPVGELLDMVHLTARDARVLERHPLQPFDPRNFEPPPWSFDPVTLDGARALSAPRTPPRPFLAGPLPAREEPLIELDDLVRFVEHPVKAFLRQRLGISVGDYDDEVEDDLSVELDGLGKWAVGQRLVDARLAGVEGRTAVLAEIARGTLPPGVLGEPVIQEVFPIADRIVAEARGLVAAPPGSVDVRVPLPGGRTLTGTVAGVCRDVLLTVTYSRVAAKHRLAAWAKLLALSAAHPDREFTAATVGRGEDGVALAWIRHVPADAAREQLAALVDLRDRGLREPLPLYCQTSAAYADAARRRDDAAAVARKAWKSEWSFAREDQELEHQLVLGGVAAFEDLLAAPPAPGEDWDPLEATRLGALARRLWDGLLAAEDVGPR